MKDLQIIREEIDEIDGQIVSLYEERMQRTTEVAEYKISVGKPVLDKQRESEKLERVRAQAKEENRYGVGELFEHIMAMSRKRQYQLLRKNGQAQDFGFAQVDELPFYTKKIVYQGTQGAYSQLAMKAYFGEDMEGYHVDTWRDAMEAICKGEADYAVLPIENSSAGIVGENFDLMLEYDNYIVAEQTIKIEHALLGLPDAEISDIRTVYSHPQALMQSVDFLDEHSEWERVSVKNTAVAAKQVVKEQRKDQAAIASEVSAELYGLKILKNNINYSDENSTRFIIVGGKKIRIKGAQKVSICFETAHESGSLYRMLSHFMFNNLNMVKIESRPMKDKSFEYRFFVDLQGNLGDGAVQNALRGLVEESLSMKVLGNY
ncbi:MAG: prephenate dehydratase [Lachnospiraceae bacterium]|jgi:Prephenate dehydratase|nr:prephenate dehydratase [Lachnospiraceae bacterium]